RVGECGDHPAHSGKLDWHGTAALARAGEQIGVRYAAGQAQTTASCAVEREWTGEVHLLGQGEDIRFGPVRARVLRHRERLDLLGRDVAGGGEPMPLPGQGHVEGRGTVLGHGSMLVRGKFWWDREAVGPRWPW